MTDYSENPAHSSREPRGRHAAPDPTRFESQAREGGPAASRGQAGGHQQRAVQASAAASARLQNQQAGVRSQGGQNPPLDQAGQRAAQASAAQRAVRPETSQQRVARPDAPRQQRAPQGAYQPAQANAAQARARSSANGGGQMRPPQGPRPGGMVPVDPSGKNRKRGKKGPWRIVFWVALAVFLVAACALGAIAYTYWQGQHAYESVADQVFEAPADIEGTALSELTVDWDALRAINPDVVGWIYIPDTVVNYPIVHSGDDVKYLTYDFNGNQGGSWLPTYGAIFLSGDNATDFSDVNNIIYGHNLMNGAMFATLAGFADEAQFNAHRSVYILTPQGNFRLTSFSLIHCDETDPIVQTSFVNSEERTAYVQDKMDACIVSPNPAAPAATDISRIFTFSTCDNDISTKRYVLFCFIAESTVAVAAPAGQGNADLADPTVAGAIDSAAAGAVAGEAAPDAAATDAAAGEAA